MNNTKDKLKDLSDKVFELQDKLTDKEFKDLLDGLGSVFKDIERVGPTIPRPQVAVQPQNPQNTQNPHHLCICSKIGRAHV